MRDRECLPGAHPNDGPCKIVEPLLNTFQLLLLANCSLPFHKQTKANNDQCLSFFSYLLYKAHIASI